MRASKHSFAFKQFTIQQEQCAMKVSTDACIQGAWLPLTRQINTVLDVGAGTGLLSLMLAQRCSRLSIHAIELDELAAKQAAKNVAASPFASRITVQQADARKFDRSQRYDLIICNPPFFSHDLAGENEPRNSVRHDALLTAEDIISLAGRAIQADGALCIMWPERRMTEWRALMNAAGFGLCHELQVRNRAGARISSVISVWSKTSTENPSSAELVIRQEDGHYTSAFTALLSDFYLRL